MCLVSTSFAVPLASQCAPSILPGLLLQQCDGFSQGNISGLDSSVISLFPDLACSGVSWVGSWSPAQDTSKVPRAGDTQVRSLLSDTTLEQPPKLGQLFCFICNYSSSNVTFPKFETMRQEGLVWCFPICVCIYDLPYIDQILKVHSQLKRIYIYIYIYISF